MLSGPSVPAGCSLPWPLLQAAVFCVYNGYMQVGHRSTLHAVWGHSPTNRMRDAGRMPHAVRHQLCCCASC